MTTSLPSEHLIEDGDESLVQEDPQGNEIDMPDVPTRSNPVGPKKLRIGPKANSTGKMEKGTDGEYEMVEVYDEEERYEAQLGGTKVVVETTPHSQSVTLELSKADRSRPLPPPPIEPETKKPAVSQSGGNDRAPKPQAGVSVSDTSFHEELQMKLHREIELREKAEQSLQAMLIEADDFKKRWKQTARELKALQRQGQPGGLYQVTDNYLIDLITRLRYNIRNFSIQYFSGLLGRSRTSVERELQNLHEREPFFQRYMESLTPGTQNYQDFLLSPDKRPCVIQAFLWKVIVYRIFGQFRWAGSASAPLWNLCDVLNPDVDSNAPPNPESEKKFQVWSATTVGFLFSAMNMGPGSEAHEEFQQFKMTLTKGLHGAIGPFQSGNDEGYSQELSRIIDEATELDKEISRQVSKVQWILRSDDYSGTFNPSTMELERNEKSPGANSEVVLVTSPAVTKRGKSTGEAFHEETLLMRMEVSCELPYTSGRR